MAWIRLALPHEGPAIHEVMRQAHAALLDPRLFVLDDLEMVGRHLDGPEGYTVVALEGERIVGVQIVRLPGDAADNLGRVLGIGEARLRSVAHLESIAVLPVAQGCSLGRRLVEAAIAELPGHVELVASTVAPDNAASLRTLAAAGFRPVARVARYGGLDRLVLVSDLRPRVTT